MTTDERFERIEHVTAGLAEERRKDREEYRQLWRDTQRQLHDLTLKIADTNDTVARLAEETRAETVRAQAAEQELRDRVSNLVSAIGQLISRPSGPSTS